MYIDYVGKYKADWKKKKKKYIPFFYLLYQDQLSYIYEEAICTNSYMEKSNVPNLLPTTYRLWHKKKR